MNNIASPQPIFDTIENIADIRHSINLAGINLEDLNHALLFLKSYKGSLGTFNAYRREIERLLHWSWLLANKSVKELRRADIEAYLAFCQSPPLSWIGTKKVPRFIEVNGERTPSPAWRPFVVTISKSAHRLGNKPVAEDYALSSTAIKDIFAITSSFFNFLIQEDYTEVNPILHIRQKSKYLRAQQSKPRIRRLSELQWEYVIETAEQMAIEQPDQHHRTLFIMSSLYAMYSTYLRIGRQLTLDTKNV